MNPNWIQENKPIRLRSRNRCNCPYSHCPYINNRWRCPYASLYEHFSYDTYESNKSNEHFGIIQDVKHAANSVGDVLSQVKKLPEVASNIGSTISDGASSAFKGIESVGGKAIEEVKDVIDKIASVDYGGIATDVGNQVKILVKKLEVM